MSILSNYAHLEICRVCEKTNYLQNIFIHSNRICLEQLKSFIQVEDENFNKLPKYICKLCRSSLEFAFNFRSQCEEIDQKYRNMINRSKSLLQMEIKSEPVFEINEDDDLNMETIQDGYGDDLLIEQKNGVFSENDIYDVDEKQEDDEYSDYSDEDEDPETGGNEINPFDLLEIIQEPNEFDELDTVDDDKPNIKKEKSKMYTCPTCNEVFVNFGEFRNHVTIHGTKRFQCPQCQMWFGRRSNMKRHLLRFHNYSEESSSLECKICHKTFKRISNVNRHIRSVHNREIRYWCSVCGKGFYESSGMREHENSHNETRNFACELCNKTFKTQSILNKHTRTSHRTMKRSSSQSEN